MCQHSGPLSATANSNENQSELENGGTRLTRFALLAARYRGERHDYKKTLERAGRANSPDLCQFLENPDIPPLFRGCGRIVPIGFYRKRGNSTLRPEETSLAGYDRCSHPAGHDVPVASTEQNLTTESTHMLDRRGTTRHVGLK
jgi:hypothetical protein